MLVVYLNVIDGEFILRHGMLLMSVVFWVKIEAKTSK